MADTGWRDDGIEQTGPSSWLFDGRIAINDDSTAVPRAWCERPELLATFHVFTIRTLPTRVIVWQLSVPDARGVRVAHRLSDQGLAEGVGRRLLPADRRPRIAHPAPHQVPAAIQRVFDAAARACEESLQWLRLEHQFDVQRNPWWKNPPQDDDLVQMAMGYILDYDNESESAARGLAELKSEISGLDRERLEDLLLFRLLEHARTGLDADDELDESEATSP